MNPKRWILFVIIFLFLIACQAQSLEETSVHTPTPVESALPTATAVRFGITILADGLIQAARPELPLGFEMDGKLTEIFVLAGDLVQEGDVLAQLEEAESLESRQAAVTSAELSVLIASQALDDLYTNAAIREAEALQAIASAQDALNAIAVDIPIQQSNALKAIADAQEAVREAQYRLNSLGAQASEAAITAAQSDVTLTAERLERAEKAYQPYRDKPDGNLNKAYFGAAWADAQNAYDAAVRYLNSLTGSPSDITQAQKEAELAVAQAQLAQAQATYDSLAAGIPPADLALAQAQFAATQVAYAALENGIDPDELALAEAELANTQIQLILAQNDLEEAVDAQDDIFLVAPWTGIVINLEFAPGARVGSGIPILTLLDTTVLEFQTTNLSERDLAKISPGQTAQITLKAYPDDPFEAQVLRVGWQVGEFVGDAATFPVILSLSTTDLDIRPGMTGQVEIYDSDQKLDNKP